MRSSSARNAAGVRIRPTTPIQVRASTVWVPVPLTMSLANNAANASRLTPPARLGSVARRSAGVATRQRCASTANVATDAHKPSERCSVSTAWATPASGSTASRLPGWS